jgi:hypothetical protein
VIHPFINGCLKLIPILKNNLTALARLAVLGVLSVARRLVILFLELVLQCFDSAKPDCLLKLAYALLNIIQYRIVNRSLTSGSLTAWQ